MPPGCTRTHSGLGGGAFPEYLIGSGFTRSATEAIADHRAYADAAKQAAHHALAAFVDLQSYFGAPGLFRADQIHMTDAGNARIVEVVTPDVLGPLSDEMVR